MQVSSRSLHSAGHGRACRALSACCRTARCGPPVQMVIVMYLCHHTKAVLKTRPVCCTSVDRSCFRSVVHVGVVALLLVHWSQLSSTSPCAEAFYRTRQYSYACGKVQRVSIGLRPWSSVFLRHLSGKKALMACALACRYLPAYKRQIWQQCKRR
jgi:hypothetical protein